MSEVIDAPWEPTPGSDEGYALFTKERRVIADDGTPIAATFRNADGPGVPIVFANGWSCSDAYWGELLPLLEAAGHPCLLPDTRGHGGSGLPRHPGRGARNLTIDDVSMPRIARDLVAVLDDAGVRDAVGHDPLGGVKAVAREIKNSVGRATGLTCSIGVTPNKLLSKIASDLDKPDGLTVLTMDDLPTRIWPLPVRRVNGIGPKAGAKLAALGVNTIGELSRCEPLWLIERFGRSYGAWLHAAAWGRDDRPVVTESEPVSISRETTFEHDLHAVRDKARLSTLFTDLCVRVAEDLHRKGYTGRTVGIKLRYEDFKTVTRDLTLPQPTADAAEIRHAAGLCLKRVDLRRRLRLLGVRVANLQRADAPLAPSVKRGTRPNRPQGPQPAGVLTTGPGVLPPMAAERDLFEEFDPPAPGSARGSVGGLAGR